MTALSFFVVLVCLGSVSAIAGTIHVQPGVEDSGAFDNDFRSNVYQACATATNAVGAAALQFPIRAGTACITYNTLGQAIDWSIVHSFNPLDIASLTFSATLRGAAVPAPAAIPVPLATVPIGGAAGVLRTYTRTFVSDLRAPALPFRPRVSLAVPPTLPNAPQAPQAPQADPAGDILPPAHIRVGDIMKRNIHGGTALNMEGFAADNYAITITLQSTYDGVLTFVFNQNNMVKSDSFHGVVRNTVSHNKNRKYAPRAAEDFTPLGNNVLLWRNIPQRETERDLSMEIATMSNDLKVVKVGSAAMGTINVGATVWARMDLCLTSLIILRDTQTVQDLPTQTLLANSPYCVVPVTALVGRVNDGTNRAAAFSGHVGTVGGGSAGVQSGFNSLFFSQS